MFDAAETGAVLKTLRERAGLTQRELAERLGIHQPAVARWEAGRVRIPVNRLEEIVAELGYGLEYSLRAIPLADAITDGVPVTLVDLQPKVS
ncbi:MAG: helix-turn-helix domain-containing protein [Acidimicrobiales bacterium]